VLFRSISPIRHTHSHFAFIRRTHSHAHGKKNARESRLFCISHAHKHEQSFSHT